MIEVKNIFPECEADTLLVSLILQRGPAGHRKGITKVNDALKIDTDRFIIAVIDTDKFKNEERYKYIMQFTETVEDKLKAEKLLIIKKPDTNKHIIRLHPGFEKWIWELAISCGIQPLEYGFDSLESLKRGTKQLEVSENKELKKLINKIVYLNPQPIQTLRNRLIKAIS